MAANLEIELPEMICLFARNLSHTNIVIMAVMAGGK